MLIPQEFCVFLQNSKDQKVLSTENKQTNKQQNPTIPHPPDKIALQTS